VIEIRFCPILHVLEGLTPQEVVDAACRGFARGCAECGGIGNPIIGGLIICALRNLSPEHGVAMAELAAANLGKTGGVIGWDLAAEEGPHPMAKHMPGLRRAVELGVPCTVHAGEVSVGSQTIALLPWSASALLL
jgi:adenosine deaminase